MSRQLPFGDLGRSFFCRWARRVTGGSQGSAAAERAASLDRVLVRQAYRSSPARTPGREHRGLDCPRRAVVRRHPFADCRRELVVAAGQVDNQAETLAHRLQRKGRSSRAGKVSGAGTVGAFVPSEDWGSDASAAQHGAATSPRRCSSPLASLLPGAHFHIGAMLGVGPASTPWNAVVADRGFPAARTDNGPWMERVKGIEPS